MNCPKCNAANPEGAATCTACGAALNLQTPPPPPPAAPFAGSQAQETLVPPRTSGLAIASLVLGILGLCTAGLSGLVGLVLGIISLSQINASKGQLGGKGVGTAGIVVSACMSFAIVPAILASIFFPVIAKSREDARQHMCMANQRQLALAVQIYAADHNEQLPADLSSLKLNSTLTLVCPTAGKDANGFGYNGMIGGMPMNRIETPGSAVVVTADSKNSFIRTADDIDPRHGDKFIASYLDGHVEMLKAGTPVQFK